MDGGNAVVVGGGIGGLAAAIGLRRIGWEVTVLERAAALGDAGAGISLHANGMRALDALGVGAGVREAARPQYTGGTRVPGGGRLARMDGAALERALGTPIVGIPRATLHRLLRAALPADVLIVGAEASSLDLTARHRVGVVTGGGVREADLVVAADGVNSGLRALLFPGHPGPAYSGSTVLRALTDSPVPLASDFELTWGRGAEFGHITFNDGRAEWHAVLNSPPGVRHQDPLAVLRRRFRNWHEPIPALLAATRPEAVLHHDIHELAAPLPAFTSGRGGRRGGPAPPQAPHPGPRATHPRGDAGEVG
ncbi:FAD-dependent monooxygenase, partial [Streptomyces sp. NPDC057540]|uniref:FAD-dependent monooxygenase n=1 Tax=Streptomyces sp. NPDC057540 TaxID=3346160 RepID=UPI003680D007